MFLLSWAYQNWTMTYPRSQLVAEGEPGFYQVVSPVRPMCLLVRTRQADRWPVWMPMHSCDIALVQRTGEQARSDKRGQLKPLSEHGSAAPVDIWQVASHPKVWLRQVQGTEDHYYRAIGSAEALMAKATELGQVWMKGVAGEVARKVLRERPT